MAKQKPESFPIEPVKPKQGFAGFDDVVPAAPDAIDPEPARLEPEPSVPAAHVVYDLTNVAVLHDLRKKGLLWRVKCEGCECFLCVCETEKQAICLFRGKYPLATGSVKATQLRA